MKKETFFSIGFILLGLVFEYLYMTSDSEVFDAKFAFLGTLALLAGIIGLWLFTILPALKKKKD